jgi:outer membrane lipoprotein carrier protein
MSPATILTIALVAAPAVAGPASGPSSADVVAGLQASYEATTDLMASFEQVYTYKVGGLTKSSTGRIFMKKPGRMRFDYLTPSKRHFISDGEVLWVYEPDQAQAFQDSLKSSQSAVVVSLLLGGGDIEKDFDHSLLAADEGGRHQLQLVPRKSARTFRRVVLTLDPSSFRVMGVRWEDPTGNHNHMVFGDLKANVGLPEDEFSFTPPAGTRVIKAPSAPSPAAAPPASSDKAGSP